VDPATLLLTLTKKNPSLAASAARAAMPPGTENVVATQGSLVEEQWVTR
jgi:hypothetical protein